MNNQVSEMSEILSANAGGDRSGTVAELTTNEFMIKVKNCELPKIGANYYRMESDPRGFCLIFNIYEFPNSSYNIRNGSNTEAKNLSEIFEELHFISKVVDNPSRKELESMVDEYSQRPELEKQDAFVLIVLSHGLRDGFVASDGLYISFKDIVDKLNNKNCRKLIDKPKLFFFSCCRGDTKDPGVTSVIQALDDLHMNAVSDTVKCSEGNSTSTVVKLFPMVSDIMICYSTVDGFVSWRCEEKGTWLGMALYTTLLKNAHNKDLLSMLTEISNTVDEKIANPETKTNFKQVVEVILRGFKKKFYFNPGHLINTTGDQTAMLV